MTEYAGIPPFDKTRIEKDRITQERQVRNLDLKQLDQYFDRYSSVLQGPLRETTLFNFLTGASRQETAPEQNYALAYYLVTENRPLLQESSRRSLILPGLKDMIEGRASNLLEMTKMKTGERVYSAALPSYILGNLLTHSDFSYIHSILGNLSEKNKKRLLGELQTITHQLTDNLKGVPEVRRVYQQRFTSFFQTVETHEANMRELIADLNETNAIKRKLEELMRGMHEVSQMSLPPSEQGNSFLKATKRPVDDTPKPIALEIFRDASVVEKHNHRAKVIEKALHSASPFSPRLVLEAGNVSLVTQDELFTAKQPHPDVQELRHRTALKHLDPILMPDLLLLSSLEVAPTVVPTSILANWLAKAEPREVNEKLGRFRKVLKTVLNSEKVPGAEANFIEALNEDFGMAAKSGNVNFFVLRQQLSVLLGSNMDREYLKAHPEEYLMVSALEKMVLLKQIANFHAGFPPPRGFEIAEVSDFNDYDRLNPREKKPATFSIGDLSSSGLLRQLTFDILISWLKSWSADPEYQQFVKQREEAGGTLLIPYREEGEKMKPLLVEAEKGGFQLRARDGSLQLVSANGLSIKLKSDSVIKGTNWRNNLSLGDTNLASLIGELAKL